MNIGDELIYQEYARDPPKEQNGDEKYNKSPRLNTEIRGSVLIEGKPCADIDKACTVQNQIDNGRKCFLFRLMIEMTIP